MLPILFAASAVNHMAGYLGLFLLSVTTSSYLAMNFYGATPFTSPSGVEKERPEQAPAETVNAAEHHWKNPVFDSRTIQIVA